MPTLTEGRHAAEFILSEANGQRSRDNAKIASGAGKVDPSSILGQITVTKKYVPHAPGASDGSEVAKAILLIGVDATSADAPCVVVARDAEVKGSELKYHASTDTQNEKDAVHAALAAVGIIVR